MSILLQDRELSIGQSTGTISFTNTDDRSYFIFQTTAILPGSTARIVLFDAVGKVTRSSVIDGGTGIREIPLGNTGDAFSFEAECLKGRIRVSVEDREGSDISALGVEGSTAVTTIGTAGEFVPIAGTMEILDADGFTSIGNTALSYEGLLPRTVYAQATLVVEKDVGVSAADVECKFITSSTRKLSVSGFGRIDVAVTIPTTLTPRLAVIMGQGDTLQLLITNSTDTDDLIVTDLVCIVQKS